MAKQPETSDDKDEGDGRGAFVEGMRRLLRVKKDEVKRVEGSLTKAKALSLNNRGGIMGG